MSDSAGGQPEPEPYPDPPSDLPPAAFEPPGHSVSPAPPADPAPARKPGVIPLRPLALAEIFNGAIACIRKNPKATIGVTTVVVVAAQLVGLALRFSPLAAVAAQMFDPSSTSADFRADIGATLVEIARAVTTAAATIALSGLLTVVVGRAVFGASMTPGEAWQRARGRLLALVGLTALQGVAIGLLVAIAIVGTFTVAAVAGPLAAVPVGMGAFLIVIVAVPYIYTILLFAPAVIVLERLSIGAAITRSFKLVRTDFWRVFGIGLLANVVAFVIALAVSVPFSIVAQVFLLLNPTATDHALALVIGVLGAAIGQIVTAPFNAGVVVLLYADRRMRAEAFDLVLQTGAATPVSADGESTDALWQTAHP